MIVNYDEREILELIDSTLLKPDATVEDITELCQTAKDNDFAAVIVNPVFVKKCRQLLKGSPVKVGTVIGFPLGGEFGTVKRAQVKAAKRAGAQDLDIVMPIYLAKQGQWEDIYKELKKVVKACGRRTVKIIIETCYLNKEEIIKACQLCVKLKVRFVKTSTGYGSAGANAEDVAMMVKAIKGAVREASRGGTDKDLHTIEVKASGGIKTYADAVKMAHAGAKRIGTTSAYAIAAEAAAVAAAIADGLNDDSIIDAEPAVVEESAAVINEPEGAVTDTEQQDGPDIIFDESKNDFDIDNVVTDEQDPDDESEE